jgi:hypothetical protein
MPGPIEKIVMRNSYLTLGERLSTWGTRIVERRGGEIHIRLIPVLLPSVDVPDDIHVVVPKPFRVLPA